MGCPPTVRSLHPAAARRRPTGRARAAAIGLTLLLAAPAMAQDPQDQRPGITIRREGTRLVMSVNEREGTTLREFVKIAEQITGKAFTYDENEFINQNPNLKVTWVGTKSMETDEFFAFFTSMLYIKGFALVLRGKGNTEMLEIVALNSTKRNEIQASAVFVPPEQLGDFSSQTGMSIISYVRLEHIRASAASQALRPFFASTGQTTLQIGQTGSERALLLQGFAPQVANAYEILRLVDQPEDVPDQEVSIVDLHHQSAEEMAPILEELLGDRPRAAAAGEGVSGAALPGQAGQIKILAHTNREALVLSGTREQVLEATNIIAQLDLPMEAAQEDTHVVRLRNVLAEELRQTLEQFIQRDLQAQQSAQAGQGATGGARRPRQTVVLDHKASNSLLLSGTATAVESLKRTIDKLDVRQPQVLIEAAIVELTTTDLMRFGLELGALDIANDDFTRPFGFTQFGLSTFTDTDENGLPDTRLPDFENPLRGFTGGIISSGDFAVPVLVSALASDQRANILSLPSVVVSNNQNATVRNAEERPTQTTQQGTATTSQGFGGFQDAGINLAISPSISSNNYLNLNITLTVSRFISSFDPTSSTPGVKVTREITTNITMPSGATMVLGGVIEDAESENDDGIPFLKDIPLLGWLFRSYNSTKTKTNLYFFLTPHVLDEEDFSDLAEISFRKKMEASRYIGNKRLQLVDRKWTDIPMPERLEDTGATVEHLDQFGGFEIPTYRRPPQAAGPQSPPADDSKGDGR